MQPNLARTRSLRSRDEEARVNTDAESEYTAFVTHHANVRFKFPGKAEYVAASR
jgi:hypothetical protein